MGGTLRFVVEDQVFNALPDVYFGMVTVRGVDNTMVEETILAEFVRIQTEVQDRLAGKDTKTDPAILPYREAFEALGVNPNKFRCSIEALAKRIAKGGRIPSINSMVDLVNAISLKYMLPMGCHDIQAFDSDIEVRFAREGDVFVPFGSDQEESPDKGEVVYASGNRIKTRRWIWRQSELGKAVEATTDFFIPIDGFKSRNGDAVEQAARETAARIKEVFGLEASVAFLDRDHPSAGI